MIPSIFPQNVEFALATVARLQGLKASHVITLALDSYIKADPKLQKDVTAALGKLAEGYSLEVASVKYRKNITAGCPA